MSGRVAFIGLGNMGGPMAANAVKGGFEVIAFDLSPKALAQAQAAGCETTDDARAAIAGAEFVVTMLPNGNIVERLWIDETALLDSVPPAALLIDCSTVSPETSRRVAQEAEARGLRFIDAPVSGGTAAAVAGTLSFMCGGTAAAVEAARPLLTKLGPNVFHAGGAGAGSVAKICNNMLLAVHMVGTAEALQLGINNGLDPAVLSEIMVKSSGNNWSVEKYNPVPGVMPNVPASNDYQGGFVVNLMLKDLGLALESARHSGSAVPMGSLANSLYAVHKNGASEDGALDFSSILRLFQ